MGLRPTLTEDRLGNDREGAGGPRGGGGLAGSHLSVRTVTEWVGPSRRTQALVLVHCAFSLGQMALAGLAYGVQNWRYFQVAGTAPVLLLFFYIW